MAVVPVCSCTTTAIDAEGEAEEGVTFTATPCRGPGTDGRAISGTAITKTSGADGLVTFQLIRGLTYSIYRGTSDEKAISYTVPDQAEDTLPEIIGSP